MLANTLMVASLFRVEAVEAVEATAQAEAEGEIVEITVLVVGTERSDETDLTLVVEAALMMSWYTK
jgi:hypothetical protein